MLDPAKTSFHLDPDYKSEYRTRGGKRPTSNDVTAVTPSEFQILASRQLIVQQTSASGQDGQNIFAGETVLDKAKRSPS